MAGRLDVQIPARDGRSPGTLHVPDGDGPWPGVLVFPDAGGARETFRQMGDGLLARPEVSGSAIGTTGYCLGGRMSLVAAGGLGRTIAAAASFHGGRLAVAGEPSSPHLSAGRITATVYVAGATDDGSFTAEQAELLEGALADSGVDHTLEFYPARHGFAVPDNPTYDTGADARHWEALRRLYRAHLQGS